MRIIEILNITIKLSTVCKLSTHHFQTYFHSYITVTNVMSAISAEHSQVPVGDGVTLWSVSIHLRSVFFGCQGLGSVIPARLLILLHKWLPNETCVYLMELLHNGPLSHLVCVCVCVFNKAWTSSLLSLVLVFLSLWRTHKSFPWCQLSNRGLGTTNNIMVQGPLDPDYDA